MSLLNVTMLHHYCSVPEAARDTNPWCPLWALSWLQESEAALNAHHWGMIKTLNKQQNHETKQPDNWRATVPSLLSGEESTQLLSIYSAFPLSHTEHPGSLVSAH